MLNLKVFRLTSIIFIVSALLLFIGCRTAPVYNVTHSPVPQISDRTLDSNQVRDAIIRAGNSLGWRMDPSSPGHIIGTLDIRTHQAKVDINYTSIDYSITYKDSTNLNYSGSRIHNNYNGWIKRLDSAIMNHLLRM